MPSPDAIRPFCLCFAIGYSNLGKSTIVEALRLVSLAAARYGSTNFTKLPEWLDLQSVVQYPASKLRG